MSLKQMQALDTASEVKQEPVRIMGFDCVCGRRMEVSAEQGVVPAPQRTEQKPVIDKSAAIRIATALGWEPKREWVGMTDEQKEALSQDAEGNPWVAVELAEAKLKEQNT